MDKSAYPQIHNVSPKPPFNIEKWRETALKIKMAGRQYDEYSNRELVDIFTQDWDLQEKDSFHRWLDYNRTQQNQYKRGQRTMEKMAYDFQSANKEEQLKELKKKLRGRVNSAEKLLNKILDEGLLAGGEEKALYISRILQKLKEEITMLRRPELIEARSNRAIRIIKNAGLDEVANRLQTNFDQLGMVRVAELDIASVQSEIKSELDIFNYGIHLSRLMGIKNQLEQLGRHSEAGTILEIIKKELSSLDGIHKKLVDVYTTLGQIPLERRQEERGPTKPTIEKPKERLPNI